MRGRNIFCFILVCWLGLMSSGVAQEFRATITGRVTDPSGAVIPGAVVAARNIATGVSTSTTTNASGNYVISYLISGGYALSVQRQGFQRLVRQGIKLEAGDSVTLNLVLTLGTVTQSVTVTNAAPLINTATATSGQTISAVDISQLPLEYGNPIMLTILAPGTTYNDTDGRLKGGQLWGQLDPSIVNGAISGSNEWTVNGAPQEVNDNGAEGYNPPGDAVQEVKVVSTHFDAQYGHTAGAVTNAVLKSGTNELHGNVHEFNQNTAFAANNFFSNKAGAPISPIHLNRYGLTVGGPVYIPKVYDGKDKTFFFFAFERQTDTAPEPRTDTVPTAAERNGDFSALLPAGITIYDPATATPAPKGLIARSPFPGNIIPPGEISPIAKNILSYYPSPNLPGNQYGARNYYTPTPFTDNFNTELWRIDHTLSSKDKILFDLYRGHYAQLRFPEFPKVNGVIPTEEILLRTNYGGTYDQVFTISPSTVLDLRASVQTGVEGISSGSAGQISPTKLGFSPQAVALFNGGQYFPDISISSVEGIGGDFNQHGGGGGFFSRDYIYSFQPTLSKVYGAHMIRAGLDIRFYRLNGSNPGCQEGCYSFGTDFTKGPLNTSASPAGGIGQGLASFLLGLPTSGKIDRNASSAYQTPYYAPYFQDDWKAARKLTLNLGIRYELEGPLTERFDRNIRGFDLTSANPIAAAAEASYSSAYAKGSYAKDPLAVPPANFKVQGGYLFATPQQRGIYNHDTNNIEPRVGFAYAFNEKTALRGGWGVFMIPNDFAGQNQAGFSQATSVVPSLNGGLSFVAGLADPFPSGVATPPGSSLGLATLVGNSASFYPLNERNGLTQEWELRVERQISQNWLLTLAYVGNHAYDLPTGTGILDALPAQYLSTSPTRDQSTINALGGRVTNPFVGLAPGTGLGTSGTVGASQLLLPYPEFTGISTSRFDGQTDYNAMELTVTKRFSDGFTFLANYTWSKLMEHDFFLNSEDTSYVSSISSMDAPHVLRLSGVWHLPVGSGRHFGNHWHGVVNAILGGWQASA
ncbi:MAG: carboxypeptidase regulatory-like domain-containing protein, partial [Terriglobia bacterium]